MLNKEALKDYALECGADAVGIGSMNRFEGAPKQMDPRYFYPEAKSVIGLIFRIPRGILRGIEEGTQFYQYPSLGYSGINEYYAPTTLYEVGRFIEDHGYEAAVFRNTGGRGPISDMTGKPGIEESPEESGRAISYTRPVSPDKPAPDIFIHFRIAAYICGLGEIGYSKMFLTPDFGPCNRQAFIFTDAELEPDPIYDGPKLCNNCMACVQACPGNCLDRNETVKVNIAGHKVEWGKIDEWKCFIYYEGANAESNPFMPEKPFAGREDARKILTGKKHVEAKEYAAIAAALKEYYPAASGYNPPKCGGCLRACLNSLEKRGVLNKKFNNPFRTEKPWKAKNVKVDEITF